jgi:hypothetical protein
MDRGSARRLGCCLTGLIRVFRRDSIVPVSAGVRFGVIRVGIAMSALSSAIPAGSTGRRNTGIREELRPRALRRYWSRHLRSGRAGRYEPAPGTTIAGAVTNSRNACHASGTATACGRGRGRCRLGVFSLLAFTLHCVIVLDNASVLFPHGLGAILTLLPPIRARMGRSPITRPPVPMAIVALWQGVAEWQWQRPMIRGS